MNKNGIIFDLDGTLWDVTDSTYYCANKIVEKYGLEKISKGTICNTFGCNKEDSAKKYFPYLSLDRAVQILDEISNLNIKNLQESGGYLYPDLEKTIKKLKENCNLFIVSNTAHTTYIEAFLISSKLDNYFSDYIAASKLNLSKSEAIKKIIEDNKLKKSVYVGDTNIDLEAAKIAGIPFIYANYGFGKIIKTENSINTISELPELLKNINFN